jgi:DNA-binding MarR family transcriptional regulator
MSNSITAMVQRGWVRRTAPARDRRVMIVEATPVGRAALERVRRCAEAQLAETLAPLGAPARRRLLAGLKVLRTIFDAETGAGARPHGRRRQGAARRDGAT